MPALQTSLTRATCNSYWMAVSPRIVKLAVAPALVTTGGTASEPSRIATNRSSVAAGVKATAERAAARIVNPRFMATSLPARGDLGVPRGRLWPGGDRNATGLGLLRLMQVDGQDAGVVRGVDSPCVDGGGQDK